MAEDQITDKAPNADIPDDISAMSFEKALTELEGIVRELESGRGELDQSINSYARGAALKSHCEARLKDAQMRIEKIMVGTDGEPAASPLDVK